MRRSRVRPLQVEPWPRGALPVAQGHSSYHGLQGQGTRRAVDEQCERETALRDKNNNGGESARAICARLKHCLHSLTLKTTSVYVISRCTGGVCMSCRSHMLCWEVPNRLGEAHWLRSHGGEKEVVRV
jgi:hypothetical protein